MRFIERFKNQPKAWMASLLFLFTPIILYRNIIILDPDFGWLLRMGQIILADGIPEKDPFSYTMSNYPFIAHEWLSEAFLAYAYPIFRMGWLAVFFTLLILLTVGVTASLVPKIARRWIFVPLFLSLCLITDFASIRVQIFSWFLFSLLIKALYSKFKFTARIISIPIILLVWVNMHGSFALGVVIVALFSFVKIINEKKNIFQESLLIITSILVTFINPYGSRIWQESFMTVGDRYLRRYIIEWQPAIFLADFLFWVLIAFSCFFIIRYRKKFAATELVIFFALFLLSITGMKQIPFFVLFSMPLLTKGLYWLHVEARRIKFGAMRFNKLYKGLAILVLLMYLPYLIYFLYRIPEFGEEASYPKDAALFLNEKYPSGRMFTLYHLNGYINWKLPGYKVFISGMMPIWKNHNYPGESNYAFKEYRGIMTGEISFTHAIKRYDIDTLILPSYSLSSSIQSGLAGIGLGVKKDPYVQIRNQAISSGMRIVFDKGGVIVYRSNIKTENKLR